jgi:hypothetical protein
MNLNQDTASGGNGWLSQLACSFSYRITIFILLFCSVSSAAVFFFTTGLEIADLLEKSASKFDLYVPEITILDGKASIKEKQPYLIEIPDDPNMLIVIDTRENPDPRPFSHLKEKSVGIVLSRDSLLIKNHDQVTSMKLENFPDFVLNSQSLTENLTYYRYTLYIILIVAVLIYYCLSKSIQTLVSALAIFLVIRRFSFPLSFGQGFKMATLILLPPTLVDLTLKTLGIFPGSQSIIYLSLYAGAIFWLVRDLLRSQSQNIVAQRH